MGLVDDSDDDLVSGGALQQQSSAAPKKAMPPAKKGRPAATKVTKPASKSTRRASGRIAAAIEEVGGRQALADKTNQKNDEAPVKRGRKPSAKAAAALQATNALASPPSSDAPKPKGARGRPRTAKANNSKEVQDSQDEDKSAAMTKRGRKPALTEPGPAEEDVDDATEIPETQQPNMMPGNFPEDSLEDVQMEDVPVAKSSHPAGYLARRLASASDSDKSEPALRRRLGELNKKYESLETRYRDLHDIGIKEAERTFDRLKKQAEEKTKSMYRLEDAELKAASH